ncbi:cannabidiolic acid synthase-like 1 [Senna tora]|uniref:Cannabidiolic acid synthase-like 1 n=1 Tax=Senna tora TaxID=362788 RepID=A0A834XFL7_9FABA|nr:cannabidiolic acid synthase-like 1 [Senna tora]
MAKETGSTSTKADDGAWQLYNSDQPGMTLVASQLTGGNYLSWSLAVKIALEAKDKLEFVDGTIKLPLDATEFKKWKKNDSMVKSWLTNSLSKEIAESFTYCNTSKMLWDEIQERYSASNGPKFYQIQRELVSQMQGNEIVTGYYVKMHRFASNTTRKPLLILTPLHISHIRAAIRCSRRHGLEIRTRSGGHDYEGLSYVSHVPFIVLDLINLKSIDVDEEDGVAWVQAGATIGEVYYKIAEKSKTLGFPGGVCPTTGVGGHFSGGGYGFLMRKYGLAADNIIDARVIDVKGRVLERESMGEDLFWAIRGGGGASFGVVVAWKIRSDQSNSLFYKAKSDFVRQPLSETELKGIWQMFYEEEAEFARVEFSPYGGRMDEISEFETPFPHRKGNLYKIQYLVYWVEEGDEAEKRHIDWIRRLYSYMTPFVSKSPRAAYLNYRDLDLGVNNVKNGFTSYEEASVWGVKYFKNNFNRLVQVKTKVDPLNFFKNEQSIPSLISNSKNGGN